MSSRRRIAVIGAGISGLTAAYLMRNTHQVTLLEAQPRLGGHAHTHDVSVTGGHTVAVDTGFIVHNRRTYPYLLRLFDELDVPTQRTQMSMSIRCDGCGLQYAGGRGLRGILAHRHTVTDPRFARMLLSINRFHRRASQFIDTGEDAVTLGAWLRAEGFDDYFVAHFAAPLVACVWSSGHDSALDYPARYLFRFLDNHGMLSVTGSPAWYTVTGGSRNYVDRLAARLDDVRTDTPVLGIARGNNGVQVTTDHGAESFDHVVIATHADTALRLLQDPSTAEREVLGAFSYTTNQVLLHRDDSLLPGGSHARASWNYRMASCNTRADAPRVTYWMNRLQRLPDRDPLLVTLNDPAAVPAHARIAELSYRHPIFEPTSVRAQSRVDELMTERTSYAGAHLGWGFHEDGCRSGVLAARRLGGSW